MNIHTTDFATAVGQKHQGTRLILVRHGQTAWNLERRFQGHTDIPLNAEGLRQAQLLGNYLEHLEQAQGHAVYQHCISSDLDRARTTASLIHGNRQPPLVLNPAFRERNYGHLSGLTAEEMQQKSPLEYAGMKARQVGAPIQGGESLLEFYSRVVRGFHDLLAAYPGQHILLVAHGGVLDCIYRHCTGTPLEKPRDWLLPNCALNLIDLDSKGKTTALVWASEGHLNTGSAGPNLDEVDGRIT